MHINRDLGMPMSVDVYIGKDGAKKKRRKKENGKMVANGKRAKK